MSSKRFTDTQRIDALISNMWFVEPQYHDGSYRVGKANHNGEAEHHGKTLRAAIDAAMRAEGINPGGGTKAQQPVAWRMRSGSGRWMLIDDAALAVEMKGHGWEVQPLAPIASEGA